MHGILKVKNPLESEQQKKKEKQEAYVKKFKEVIEVKDLSTSHLASIGEVLLLSPDNATLWNRRRQIIINFINTKKNAAASNARVADVLNEDMAFKGVHLSLANLTIDDKSSSEIQSLFESELRFTAVCLSLIPKSYACWYHRKWCFLLMPTPPWNVELDICNEYLSRDERNFHCWCYWSFLTSKMDLSPDIKLAFVTKKVIDNFSNYSAWHYRSQILGSDLDKETIESEHELLQNAFFTDPNDQSPWFYHRWLLSFHGLPHIIFIESSHSHIDVWTSQPLLNSRLKIIDLQDESSTCEVEWEAFDGFSSFACTGWHGTFKNDITGHNIKLSLVDNPSESFELSVPSDPNMLVQRQQKKITLHAPKFRNVLLNELEKLKSLNTLEPNSKWCLLGMATLMHILDVLHYKNEIISVYDSLCELDKQRKGYYEDSRSKIIFEYVLLKTNPLPPSIDLSSQRLTSLYLFQYFHSVEELNVCDNKLRSLNGIQNLRHLKTLYARNNHIRQIEHLLCCPCLIFIDIRFNDVCKNEDCLEQFAKAKPQCVLVSE